jgi:hypothetical protein
MTSTSARLTLTFEEVIGKVFQISAVVVILNEPVVVEEGHDYIFGISGYVHNLRVQFFKKFFLTFNVAMECAPQLITEILTWKTHLKLK